MGLGEPGDVVAERMRYRYYAKLEFVRAQARQMIRKTLHNRTRKLTQPKIGDMVFFWRDNQHKRNSPEAGGLVLGSLLVFRTLMFGSLVVEDVFWWRLNTFDRLSVKRIVWGTPKLRRLWLC
jgi:hypothetical protein